MVGHVDIFTSVSRFGGMRNFTDRIIGVRSGQMANLSFPDSGFVIFKSHASASTVTVRFATNGPVTTVSAALAVKHNTLTHSQIANLASNDALALTPHVFFVVNGRTSHFNVSPTGIVTTTRSLDSLRGTTITLAVRATPQQDTLQCNDNATVINIVLSLEVSSPTLSSSNNGASSGDATSIALIVMSLLFLTTLLVLITFLVRRQFRWQNSSETRKCDASGQIEPAQIVPNHTFSDDGRGVLGNATYETLRPISLHNGPTVYAPTQNTAELGPEPEHPVYALALPSVPCDTETSSLHSKFPVAVQPDLHIHEFGLTDVNTDVERRPSRPDNTPTQSEI